MRYAAQQAGITEDDVPRAGEDSGTNPRERQALHRQDHANEFFQALALGVNLESSLRALGWLLRARNHNLTVRY